MNPDFATPENPAPGAKTVVGAVTTVAAVYVYFLLFAQFGFLQAAQKELGDDIGALGPIMAVMGLAGVAGSGVAGLLFSEQRGRSLLTAGFGICALAAAATSGATGPAGFEVVAGLTGLGTGLTTVALAGILRRAVGGTRLGLIVGLGTGLAYGFCNLPGVFDASAPTQARLALLAVAAGWAGGRTLGPVFPPEPARDREYSGLGLVAWVVIFSALVGLDSTAFYFIQHTPALKTATWAGAGKLTLNAAVHLGAAVLAGRALDRGGLGRIAGLGAAALVLACGLINAQSPMPEWTGLLYVAGVSAYSVALVYYPVRSGRPGVAALVYALAGWGGSAVGIGLAVGARQMPAWLPVAASLLIGPGLALAHRARRERGKP